MRYVLGLGPLLLVCCLARPLAALTYVLDFNDPLQANTTDVFGQEVTTFNVASFGLAEAQRAALEAAILAELLRDFHDIPTAEVDPLSPIPAGKQLNIDFLLGEIGTPPSNGDGEYYYMQLGTKVTATSSVGQACFGCVRNSIGAGPFTSTGAVVGSVLTDNIRNMPLPSPYGAALTSGNLGYTTHAIAGTLSHEIAHTVRLDHVQKSGALTPHTLSPLMGTGALDLPNVDRIFDREFAYSAKNGSLSTVMNVTLLVAALGLRDAPLVTLPEAAVPEPATLVPVAAAVVFSLWRRRRAAK